MEFSYRFCDKEFGLKPQMRLNINNHLYNPKAIQGCRTWVSLLSRRLHAMANYIWPFQGRASYLSKNKVEYHMQNLG